MSSLYLCICVFAAVIVYEASKKKNIGALRASAGATLIFAVLVNLLDGVSFMDGDRALVFFYGASFVGMSSGERVGRLGVLIAGALFYLIFIGIGPYVKGIGGSLGLSAFLSLFVVVTFQNLFQKVALK